MMKKPVSRQLHGLADYAFATVLATAPGWAGYQQEKTAATLSRVLSAGALAYTLGTRAEWGLFPLLSFKAHLALDAPAAALTASAPWIFGFSANKGARNTFLALGLFGGLVTLLSRPEEQPLNAG